MANQQQKTRATKQTHSDDEIDLFELLHFLVKGSRYWLSGGLISGLMGLMYALNMFPSTYQQQTINDIELNQESLNLVRQVMPAMTVPLADEMKTQGLEGLYYKITKGGAGFLNKTVFGLSGVNIKDKSLDKETKGKIDTVVITLKSNDQILPKHEINFIRNNIRGLSQYLAIKRYLDNEIIDAKINLFNSRTEVNKKQISYERASRQLMAYQALENESNKLQDMQIILNLTNSGQTSLDDKEELGDIAEFSAAKYLPIGNRIVALKSEMADHQEAVRISELQIEALKLYQKVLNDLSVIFNETPYKGDVIDLSTMMQLIQDYREDKTDYTREEIAAINSLERQLIDFDRSGYRFTNSLPMVVEKKGRKSLILISGLIGAFLGFLFYAIKSLINTYRRRYKN